MGLPALFLATAADPSTVFLPAAFLNLISLTSLAFFPTPRAWAASRNLISSTLARLGFLFAMATRVTTTPLIDVNFADPTIVQDADGTWYAFATSSGDINIQVAYALTPSGPWTYLANHDALPNTGAWTSPALGETWAPDVRRLDALSTYIMYYSGLVANNSKSLHCVGVATSPNITGPYSPSPSPWACPLSQGGAIDPSGFVDVETSRRYVTYKVDGNAIGNGGDCNNGVAPYSPTPLMLQEVDPSDGMTTIGAPVELLDRTQEDGPLVEAPNIVRVDDGVSPATYILFYSSHCYNSPEYNVNSAIASNITGPYSRNKTPLIATGDFNMSSPGGATSIDGGGFIVFHSNCAKGRCMFCAEFTLIGNNVNVSMKKTGYR